MQVNRNFTEKHRQENYIGTGYVTRLRDRIRLEEKRTAVKTVAVVTDPRHWKKTIEE